MRNIKKILKAKGTNDKLYALLLLNSILINYSVNKSIISRKDSSGNYLFDMLIKQLVSLVGCFCNITMDKSTSKKYKSYCEALDQVNKCLDKYRANNIVNPSEFHNLYGDYDKLRCNLTKIRDVPMCEYEYQDLCVAIVNLTGSK